MSDIVKQRQDAIPVDVEVNMIHIDMQCPETNQNGTTQEQYLKSNLCMTLTKIRHLNTCYISIPNIKMFPVSYCYTKALICLLLH